MAGSGIGSRLTSLIARRARRSARAARIPAGMRVYAIGDIHGRADLLAELHRLIWRDAQASTSVDRHIVYLGDYIDRGPSSRAVLDILSANPLRGFTTAHLLGNHEDAALQFLADPVERPAWLAWGGLATLASYGITTPVDISDAEMRVFLRDRLSAALPDSHRRFLGALNLSTRVGDYVFVHAGVRPGVSVDRQERDDLLWIRDEFLTSREDLGAVVVHGHTARRLPELKPNRIGIDTGAFATGRLTALVLDGNQRRFLSTGLVPTTGRRQPSRG